MKLFILLLLFPSIFCQLPLLDNQPYFRPILTAIPGLRENREFSPQPEDIENRPVVTIRDGTLRGFTLRTIYGRAVSSFQSIPYAQPPVGNMRFRDPVKNLPWSGVRDASRQSPLCIQFDLFRLATVHGEEDCLYLNVYVPQIANSNGTKFPVIVFLPGGAFSSSGGSLSGPRYLLDKDVILVTVDYRLGPFGFLSTGDDASPGNQGLKDQLLALKWVQENIAAFGGDPNSVTLVGQSSGASSVGLHLVSPSSRGLFHRAILMSSSSLCNHALDTRKDHAVSLSKQVGEVFKCPTNSSHEMVECLRRVPGRLLSPVQFKFVEWLVFPIYVFLPIVEHEHSNAFLTKRPEQYYEDGEASNVTIISGLTKDEAAIFVTPLIRDVIHINDINTDWDRVGPLVLSLDYNTTDVMVETARKIWDFYMGEEKLSWDTRMRFSEMASDRFFTECSLEAMRYHSMYTNQSVYGYRFTHEGKYGFVQMYGDKPENWGVVHADDLIYLFNSPNYYASLEQDDPDTEMSSIITSIWSNFATYDKPYFPNGREIWQPIEPATDRFSPLRILDLNLDSKMMDDPYVDRYNFWRREINPDS